MNYYIAIIQSNGINDHGAGIHPNPEQAILDELKKAQMVYRGDDQPFKLLQAMKEDEWGDLSAVFEAGGRKVEVRADEVIMSDACISEIRLSIGKQLKKVRDNLTENLQNIFREAF